MASSNSGEGSSGAAATAKIPKKANLLDQHSVKHLLDESVSEIVAWKGYPEDVRVSNLRLLVGVVIIAIALLAQFYPKNYTKEKEAILFTYPPPGSFTSTGLVISSKLPRFSDMYTLMIASADPKSISANKPVQLTRSVTKWFTKDGILAEGLLWKDVEKLIDDYATDRKSKFYSSTLQISH
ncbi:hypothetical protein Taro_052421 [Colocasia esculenta]|uniref:Signal peptidase complex subunit 2 n=1 Tax=Colocasia esculenta TaxID=4460 RepID=A0A843XJB3_COLES|nr:hypothetical protein [Colocasia esculenta]